MPRVWRTALGLALGPAVVLGLARFAYGLLLPSMRSDLGWSFARAGTINAANAGGYLAGALIAAPVCARVGPRQAFMGGMIVTSAAVLASGASGLFGYLLVLRVIAGVAGAVTFIAGAALTAGIARDGNAGTLLCVYVAGGGLGIALSGIFVPVLLDRLSWRVGWVALGGLSMIGAGLAEPAARRARTPPPRIAAEVPRWNGRPISAVLLSYFCFGGGYIAYVTFIVAFLRHEGAGTGEISAFWCVLGLTGLFAAFGWGRVMDTLGGGRSVALATGTVTVGAFLPLISGAAPMAFLSAVVFGGSFLAVPAAVTSFARRHHEPHHWTIAISALTVGFAFGQCLGPVMAGVLSDGPSGIRAGLTLSVAILAAGAVFAVAQPRLQDVAAPTLPV
jgi:predicted MFS family arabinose efflux permease